MTLVFYGFAAEQNGFTYTLIPTLTLTITQKVFITLTTTLTLTRARNNRIRVKLACHVTKTVFCPYKLFKEAFLPYVMGGDSEKYTDLDHSHTLILYILGPFHKNFLKIWASDLVGAIISITFPNPRKHYSLLLGLIS